MRWIRRVDRTGEALTASPGTVAAGETLVDTDAGLSSVLRIAVMKLRRRLAVERDPGNPLSLGAMAVLVALHSHGELTLGQLAARERVQPPSMTRIVNFLEEAGHVVRRTSETDRRLVIVAITPRGTAVVLADRARRDVWLTDRLAELSPDELAVLRAAVPVLDRIGRA